MRPGHRRPIGSTSRRRMHDCPAEPALGILVWDGDDPDDSRRVYRVVGVEEVARAGRWNLLLERVEFETLLGVGERIGFGMVPIARPS